MFTTRWSFDVIKKCVIKDEERLENLPDLDLKSVTLAIDEV